MNDQRLTYTVQINLDPETAGKNIDSVRASLEALGVTVEKVKPHGPGPLAPVAGSATQARMAVVGLSQAMSDSGQFVYGFRSGMISVGNNLDMVVRSLIAVKAESAATGMSMKTQLLSVLTGPSGILLGVSALITAITVLPALLDDAGKAASEAAQGGLKEFADVLNSISPESRQLVGERIGRAIEGTKKQLDALKETVWTEDPTTGAKVASTFIAPANQARADVLEKRLTLLNEYAEKAKQVSEEAKALLEYEKQTANFTSDRLNTVQTLQQEIKTLQEEQKKGEIFTKEGFRIADELEKKQAQIKQLQETTTESKKREVDEEKKKLQLLEDQDQEIIKVAKIIDAHAPGMTYVSDEQQKRMERIFALTERIRIFMEQSPDQRAWLVSENQRAWIDSQLKGPLKGKDVGPLVGGLPPETDQELTAFSARITGMGSLLSSVVSSGLQRGFADGENFLAGFVDAILEAALNIATQQAAIAGVAGLISLFPGVEFGAIAGVLGSVFQFADGGVIREPVVGLGTKSMRGYMIGEKGDEIVAPVSHLLALTQGRSSDNSAIVSEIRHMRSDLRHLKQSIYVGNVVGEAELVRRQISQAERYHARKRK